MTLKPKSKRPEEGEKASRQAARTRLLREIHRLAEAAIKYLENGDQKSALHKLRIISKRGNKFEQKGK